ncbi:hypothetical protein HELRODRAFT_175124 [Helobdella robusta]|uniref:Uncharacterized protein n=1 Tax=Helobdella robusta TaxID=6412 RepID=T1F8W0_HELRO|nr:hypothetical protein HELRODRAFT_175124 [Helobdella robusta]ESO01095.1 hypothetical protein HELRODRAFT_175124 [Helobdella robusta]
MRSSERNSSTSSNVGSPIKRFFLSSSSKKKSGLKKKTSRPTKLTLSSNKSQKNIGEFFSGRSSTTPITSNNSKTTPRLRKCLFNNDSSIKSKTHSKNTSILDETSSSSFTYSSNFQRFVDVDILGQSSKLDLHANLEIVESVDAQPSTTKSENENESEKENSPKIHKSHSTAKLSDIEKEQQHPKALIKLHTAVVREVDGCLESVRENFSRPDGFYRFVEGDADERKEKVEYDLDDEDTCWLNLVRNTKINGIKNLNEDNFEMCMDRLEKMAAHLQLNSLKTNSGQIKSKHSEQLDDDDIFCSICLDDECQNSNVILLCDSCNLAVHQECYGVPLVPEGQWLCSWCQWEGSNRGKSTPRKSRCKSSKNVKFITGGDNDDDSVAVSDGNDGTCCLCPVVGGALKKTDNGKWAHVLCALWIPEVGFGSVEYLEPITKLSEVPTARHKLTCSVCKKKDVGACIQCMRKNCYTAFHIMCAQKVGTYMRIEQGVEDDDADSPTNIKKSFLCDIHKPEGAKPFLPMYENEDDDDDDDVSMEESVDASCRSKRQQSKIVPKSKSQCQLSNKKSANSQGSTKSKLNSKAGLNKSKSTSALVTSTVVLDLPTLSPNKLKEITKECLLTTTTTPPPSSSYSSSSLSSLHDVMEAVYNYWLLKRKSRNNIPLLKTYYTHLMSNHMPSKMGSTDDTKSAYDGLKDAKKLRNEMEKVRLLMELVRKREKLKLTMVKLKEQTINMKLNPWNAYLCKILDRLQTIDKCHVFAHPVAVDQVPGYKQKIKEPMDFSTMRSKVLTYKYETFEAFVRDFDLMVNNCLLFNSKHTVYHKSAVRMKKQSQHVLEEEKLRLQRFPRESLPASLANEEMGIPNFVTAHDDSDDKNNNDDDVVFKPSDNESKDNVVKICDDKNDDEENDETEISDNSKVVDRSRRNIIYSNEPIDVDNDNENDDDDNEDDDHNITLQKTCEKIQTGICRLSDWVKKQSRRGTKVESTNENGDDVKAGTCTDKVGVTDIYQNHADAVVNDASHGNSGGHENDDSDDDSLRDSTICYANDKNGNADVTCNNDDDGGGEMIMDENVNVCHTSASDSSNKDGDNIAKKNATADDDGDDDDDDDDCGIIIETIDLVREKMDGDDDGVKVGMSSSDQFFSEEIIVDDDETDDNKNVKSANDDDSNKIDDGDDLKCDGDSNDIVVETISIEDEEEICVIDKSDEEGEDGGASDDRVDEEVNDKEMLRNNILSRLDFINPESTDDAKSKSCVVDTYDNNGDHIIDDKLSFKNKIIDNSCCIGNVPSSSNSSCNNSNTNILESSINRVNFKKQTIVNFLTSLLTTVKNSSEADLQNNLKLEVKNENLTIDGNKIENVIGLNLNILPALRTFNKLMMLCSRNAVDDEEDEEEEEEEVATTATKNRENFTPNAKRQNPSDFTAPCSSFSLSSIATQNRKKFKTSKSFDMEKSKSANNKAQLNNNNNNNNVIYKAPRQVSEVPNSYSKSVTSMVKDEKVRGLEVRRTSDRPKTATHRYLIDDNLFFQSTFLVSSVLITIC